MTRLNSQSGVTLIELLVAVTLLSGLSVGMLFALRIGFNAMAKTNDRVNSNRKVMSVERIMSSQIAGLIPVRAECTASPSGGPPTKAPMFQGETQTMRFVSSFSLNEASRGYPQILELQVIPGENGAGVRLIVNEFLYAGSMSTQRMCVGVGTDPVTGAQGPIFRPVEAGPTSFVLADKLARCEFRYRQERPPDQPDVWLPRWAREGLPSAIRIDMVPMRPDPAKLQVPSITVPVRVTRTFMVDYVD